MIWCGGKYWFVVVGVGVVGNVSYFIVFGDSVVGWFCCDLVMGIRN